MNVIRTAAIGIALAVAASPAALAAHGKVGTWEVTTTFGGMPAMPNMANLPPEAQARMKAHGTMMHGHGMTSRFCMTAQEVNSDKPAMTHHGDCQAQNVKASGNTFSADVVCKGRMNGKGHIEITYSSPEHYSGRQTMTFEMNGQQMNHDMTMDAHWVSPTCEKGM